MTFDAVFVNRGFFSRLGATPTVRAASDRPVATSHVRLVDLPALGRVVDGLRTGSRDSPSLHELGTELGAVLQQAASQRAAIYASTVLVVSQLCVLGWVTLFRILQEFIGSRDAEIVLTKLRGYGAPALLRFSSSESLAVLLLAAPTGVLLGWWAAERLAAAVLLPGTPVVVLVVALAPPEPGRRGSGRGRGQCVTAAASHRHRAIPAHPAVGRTTAAVRARRRAGCCRGRGRVRGTASRGCRTRNGRIARAGTAGRRRRTDGGEAATAAARSRRAPNAGSPPHRAPARGPTGRAAAGGPRASGSAHCSLLTVGLAVFRVSGQAIAAQNRDARSAVEVGAKVVQRITVVAGDDPNAAVRRADPDGRWAAVAAQRLSFGGSDLRGTVLAVDTDRLSAVLTRVPDMREPAGLDPDARNGVAAAFVTGAQAALLLSGATTLVVGAVVTLLAVRGRAARR